MAGNLGKSHSKYLPGTSRITAAPACSMLIIVKELVRNFKEFVTQQSYAMALPMHVPNPELYDPVPPMVWHSLIETTGKLIIMDQVVCFLLSFLNVFYTYCLVPVH